MSSQNTIVRGVPLEGGDCRRLLEIVEVVERLGAPEVALEVWHHGVDVTAADNFTSPNWQLTAEFRWRYRHTESHRAFIVSPVELAEALRNIGYCTRIIFRKDGVHFVNTGKIVEVRGRTFNLKGQDRINILKLLDRPIVLFYPDPALIARLNGGRINVRLIHDEINPQAYITNAMGDIVPTNYDILTMFEHDYEYHYDGNILDTTLTIKPVRDFIILELMGSLESPMLRIGWRGQSPARPTDIDFRFAPIV